MTLEQRALTETDLRRKSLLLAALAARFRIEIFDLLREKQTGHWGGSASALEIVTTLYFHTLRIDPSDPRGAGRDRFILSKGHASPMLYTVLAHRGFFDPALLGTFRSMDSILQGHPCMNKTPGVDLSTGALGHGLSAATGMALGAKLSGLKFRTYAMVGEGCLNEGQTWEAIMTAAKYRPEGLVLLVDSNGVQLDGPSSAIMPLEPLADKFAAFGWSVAPRTYDGHDVEDILASLDFATSGPDWPKVVIYTTVKGKGVSFMEGRNKWHGSPIDQGSYAAGRPELVAAYEAALSAAEVQ